MAPPINLPGTSEYKDAKRIEAIRKQGPYPDNQLLNDAGQWIPFHAGQQRAYDSVARFVFVYAGSQGGKTSFGPSWLLREIERRGPGDYIAATSTYDLFKLKMLPALRALFETDRKIARYWPGLNVLEICDLSTLKFKAKTSNEPMWARIILRSAQAESGLESSTAKAAWLDECGMKEFGLESWEAIQRRLSIYEGRVLGTTTLYNRGWTKSQVYDRWRAGDDTYEVVQFPSYMNPAFPQAEYDRVVATMPAWKVNMFYKGEFDIPEGLVYDCFDTVEDTCDPFDIPADWVRWGGTDFGGANQAALGIAERPDGQLFVYREYLEGNRSISQHASTMQTFGAKRWWGGAPSEDQWRREFGSNGLPVLQPQVSVLEVGIDIVYGELAKKGITVFRNCIRLLDELGSYTYIVDSSGTISNKIKDKETYHLLDSLRYCIGSIRRGGVRAKVVRLGG